MPRFVAVFMVSLTGLLVACSGEPETGVESGAVVTLYGEIGEANRGALDPETEPLFTTFGLEMGRGFAVSRSQLARLEQYSLRVDYPSEGAWREFRGPLLRDVLALAVPGGEGVVVTALDGYQREIALERVRDHDVILATHMNGEPLPMGGFGPAMLVWPRQSDPALAGMSDDDWLWGVIAIELR